MGGSAEPPEPPLNTGLNKHTSRDPNKKVSTELSKYIWSLKEKNIDYSIKWSILDHAKVYTNSTKRCNLCISEKYYIICKPWLATLNKRSELLSKCRHSRKYLLNEVT